MTSRRDPPTVEVTGLDGPSVDADLLVVPVTDNQGSAELSHLDRASGGEIGRARARGEFGGRPGEIFVTPLLGDAWKCRRVALVGIGARDHATDRVRTGMAGVAADARRRRASSVAIFLRDGLECRTVAQAAIEGFLIGAYEDRRCKTTPSEEGVPVSSCLVVPPAQAVGAVTEAVHRGVVLAEAANHARDLANEPANRLTPTTFSARASELAAEVGLAAETLDDEQMRTLGMGLLLGVAQGSHEPPRLLVLRYAPPEDSAGPVLGLVGKGVTFDSGGISLKPAEGMARMKGDMAGGAAVVGAMLAIARLQPRCRCLGVVPIAENMPGGRAIRPGDVLRSASGQTVEVLNTDAEGRLLLGDALWYARRQGATHLIDVATLTGACVVALGHVASGLFGRPAEWVGCIETAAARTGERVWPMPLYDEYREQLQSETADLANVGGRPGGACTAAAFLDAFAGEGPWAHLDIAGTAWTEDKQRMRPKGATGVMVRTLAELACDGGWSGVGEARPI